MSHCRAFVRRLRRATFAAVLVAAGTVTAHAEVPRVFELASTSPPGISPPAPSPEPPRDMAPPPPYSRPAPRAAPANPELIERTFIVTVAAGNIDDAAPLAERLVLLDKNHRIARLILAARAIKQNQFAQARTHLSQAVRGPIADLTATLLTGWTYYGNNQFKNGVAAIDRLQGPEWYALFKELHAGLILDLANQRKEALKRIENARKLDATNLRTVDAYGRVLSRADRRNDALKVYGEYAKSLSPHPLVQAALQELESGKKLAPVVANAQTGAAEVLFGLGAALARQGGEDLGLVYLQVAIYLAPEHPLATVALGDLYETMKRYELAAETYDRVPNSSPLKRNAEIQRALNLDVIDKKDEAREKLDALVKENPKDLTALIAYGNVLRASKKFAEAAVVYSKIVDLIGEPQREHWTVFYFRGICYERSKQWALAEKDFELALKLMPDEPQVLNYLGYSWVDQGVNLDRALDMIRKAVALRPKDGYIVDSLGWAYYRLGRLQEASDELERAVELRPDDPNINDHLGDVYWKTDRKLEATFQWRRAKDLKPEPEDLSKIEQKLKEGLADDPKPQPAEKTEEKKNPDKG